MTADEAFEQIDTDEDGKLNGPELLNGLSALLGEDLDPAKVSRIITSRTSTSTTASTCLSGARCSVPPAKKSELASTTGGRPRGPSARQPSMGRP